MVTLYYVAELIILCHQNMVHDHTDHPVQFTTHADEGGVYLNLVGAGGCRGTKWDKDPRWPKFLGRETLDACAAKCAADDTCTAIHALRYAGTSYCDNLIFRPPGRVVLLNRTTKFPQKSASRAKNYERKDTYFYLFSTLLAYFSMCFHDCPLTAF